MFFVLLKLVPALQISSLTHNPVRPTSGKAGKARYLPELHNTSKIVGENLNLPSHSSFLNGYRV